MLKCDSEFRLFSARHGMWGVMQQVVVEEKCACVRICPFNPALTLSQLHSLVVDYLPVAFMRGGGHRNPLCRPVNSSTYVLTRPAPER